MKLVTVQSTINENVSLVWEYWTTPEHIVNWNFASPDWCCPSAEHNLIVGGKLKYRMAAKDGSMAFDYTATFTKLKTNELIEYVLDDGRKVSILFQANEGNTEIVETFEVEDENSIDLQKQGWQAILDNFKNYIEGN